MRRLAIRRDLAIPPAGHGAVAGGASAVVFGHPRTVDRAPVRDRFPVATVTPMRAGRDGGRPGGDAFRHPARVVSGVDPRPSAP